jgi:uncharacterized protein (DUF779 family)
MTKNDADLMEFLSNPDSRCRPCYQAWTKNIMIRHLCMGRGSIFPLSQEFYCLVRKRSSFEENHCIARPD